MISGQTKTALLLTAAFFTGISPLCRELTTSVATGDTPNADAGSLERNIAAVTKEIGRLIEADRQDGLRVKALIVELSRTAALEESRADNAYARAEAAQAGLTHIFREVDEQAVEQREAQSDLSDLQKEMRQLSTEIQGLERKLREHTTAIASIDSRIDAARTNRKKLESTRADEKSALKRKVKLLRGELERYQKLVNSGIRMADPDKKKPRSRRSDPR